MKFLFSFMVSLAVCCMLRVQVASAFEPPPIYGGSGYSVSTTMVSHLTHNAISVEAASTVIFNTSQIGQTFTGNAHFNSSGILNGVNIGSAKGGLSGGMESILKEIGKVQPQFIAFGLAGAIISAVCGIALMFGTLGGLGVLAAKEFIPFVTLSSSTIDESLISTGSLHKGLKITRGFSLNSFGGGRGVMKASSFRFAVPSIGR